ncbi:MAG: hypothetical protein FWF56_04955 [Firmicutes bacterium]|nr:hypothetical protein [Bacillota bacterium]MCL1954165.1 hypothetical protein [Bacillota bacterium]
MYTKSTNSYKKPTKAIPIFLFVGFLYLLIFVVMILSINTGFFGNIFGGALPIPNHILQEEGVLQWDSFRGLDGYCVNIVGDRKIVVDNSFMILNSLNKGQQYTATVQTIKDGKFSRKSHTYEFVYDDPVSSAQELSTPVVKLEQSTILSWQAVSNALSYGIFCNNVEIAQTQKTTYNVASHLGKKCQFAVKALSSSLDFRHSGFSNTLEIG